MEASSAFIKLYYNIFFEVMIMRYVNMNVLVRLSLGY